MLNMTWNQGINTLNYDFTWSFPSDFSYELTAAAVSFAIPDA